jgi:putative selenium metabolism hydrolase
MSHPLEEFAQRLVQTPSVLRNEGAVVQFARAEMERLSFDRIEVDPVGNLLGIVHGSRPGPTVLFDAHLDTVDVAPKQQWSRNPFSGDIEDGRLWGRGSSDMKGSFAAMVHALAGLDRSRLSGTAVVTGTLGEETIEGACLREACNYLARLEPAIAAPGLVVIGEASSLDLVVAGRGRAEVKITALGKPCHASSPAQGVNAVHEMFRIAAAIEALPVHRHDVVGSGVHCLTDIISNPYPAHSVVPSACTATFERRLLPGETEASMRAELEQAIAAASARAEITLATTDYTSYTGVQFREPKWYPPWQADAGAPYVARVEQALRAIGQTPERSAYAFCTNAAWSAGTAGIPTIGYGPSHEGLAHIVDEHLELDQLHAACAGYRAIAAAALAG